jgi:hypothetical protein
VNTAAAKQRICSLGDRLGYVKYCEVEARPGPRIDVVWPAEGYRRMYGSATIMQVVRSQEEVL